MPSAVVTGASQGIGRTIAIRLAEDGFDIVLNDLASQKAALEEVQSTITAKSRKAIIVTGDVSVEQDVQTIIDSTVSSFGEINVMVANAGIISMKGIVDLPVEEFNKVMSVNTTGVFLCYQKAAKQMIEQGKGGKIVGACSIAGYRGQPAALAYSTSKWAVRGMTQAVAQDLAPHGINVNAYCPGMIKTQMWDQIDAAFSEKLGVPKGVAWEKGVQDRIAMKKAPSPEDIAGCVSFLVGKDAAFITGQCVIVDGGIVFS